MRVVALDVETTGLNAWDDRVVQLAFVEFDEDICVSKWSTLVDPGFPIPQKASEINGITDLQLSAAKPFSDIAKAFVDGVGETPLVAHNAEFDKKFIVLECARTAGVDAAKIVHATWLDTHILARAISKAGRYDKGYRLKDLAERLELGWDDSLAHDALYDAVKCGEVFHALRKWLPTEIDGILDMQRAWHSQNPRR